MKMVWVEADVSDTLVSCLPKNGSSSLRSIGNPPIKGERRPFQEDVESYTHRIGIIRHPVARIQSLYKHLKGHRARQLTTMSAIPVETYERYIDHTFKTDNVHWNEQKGMLSDEWGVYSATVTHRFEDLSLWWNLYFNTELSHLNQSPSFEVSDYREVELLTKYHRDLTLWTISEMRDDREGLQFIS